MTLRNFPDGPVFLYDDATGLVVGIKQRDGSEYFFGLTTTQPGSYVPAPTGPGRALVLEAANQTAAFTVEIPAGYKVQDIIYTNVGAQFSMRVGTTANGTDVVSSQTIAANGNGHFPDAQITKKYFSRVAATTLYFSSANFNGASITVDVQLFKSSQPG